MYAPDNTEEKIRMRFLQGPKNMALLNPRTNFMVVRTTRKKIVSERWGSAYSVGVWNTKSKIVLQDDQEPHRLESVHRPNGKG